MSASGRGIADGLRLRGSATPRGGLRSAPGPARKARATAGPKGGASGARFGSEPAGVGKPAEVGKRGRAERGMGSAGQSGAGSGGSTGSGRAERSLEERRAYNREYMRRWRANPKNHERERATRDRLSWRRKLRRAQGASRTLCGLCHLREPVTTVVRLRPEARAPGGFVELRVPYCGEC